MMTRTEQWKRRSSVVCRKFAFREQKHWVCGSSIDDHTKLLVHPVSTISRADASVAHKSSTHPSSLLHPLVEGASSPVLQAVFYYRTALLCSALRYELGSFVSWQKSQVSNGMVTSRAHAYREEAGSGLVGLEKKRRPRELPPGPAVGLNCLPELLLSSLS